MTEFLAMLAGGISAYNFYNWGWYRGRAKVGYDYYEAHPQTRAWVWAVIAAFLIVC